MNLLAKILDTFRQKNASFAMQYDNLFAEKYGMDILRFLDPAKNLDHHMRNIVKEG